MSYPEEEIKELSAFGTVTSGPEGGFTYFRIAGLTLPDGCDPTTVNVLLCPHARDNYKFRLYFSSVVKSPVTHNWNGQNTRILEENWHAFSLTVPTGLRLAQMVALVVRALVP
jgi:hypothetical protein